MQPVYRRDGRFFGYLGRGRHLFDARMDYLGFATDDGRVWRADGTYLGELTEGAYVLRATAWTAPPPQVPRPHPTAPVAAVWFADRPPRPLPPGHMDALAEFP